MQIVIAWVETVYAVVDWEDVRIDLGERPKVKASKEPRAVVWLLDGDETDIERAKHMAQELYGPTAAVFVYDDAPDPLDRGRQDIAMR